MVEDEVQDAEMKDANTANESQSLPSVSQQEEVVIVETSLNDQTQTQQDMVSKSPSAGTDGAEGIPTPIPTAPVAQPQVFLGGYPIDIPFEASKLPLDVAIFNSARGAGGEDRIRKYLQAVLVVGGGALTPGMAHALESRYVLNPF